MEHRAPNGMSTDVLVRLQGYNIALEVDGPAHFTSNQCVALALGSGGAGRWGGAP